MASVAWRVLLLAGVPALVITSVLAFLLPGGDSFHEYYADSLRTSLFSGFLSVGGFLLGVKTFVIVRMKEGVYDTDAYAERWKQHKALHGRDMPRYEGLSRLKDLLFLTICAALTTACLQLTLGLWCSAWSAWICIGSAITATLALVQSMWWVQQNLTDWLQHVESPSQQKKDGKCGNCADPEDP